MGRTQTFISRLFVERDKQLEDISHLKDKLKTVNSDLIMEKDNRCKLEEKVQELENNRRIRAPEQQKRNDNNEVNKDILKDMSLLLQHRDEIRNIKETILSYQEKMCS